MIQPEIKAKIIGLILIIFGIILFFSNLSNRFEFSFSSILIGTLIFFLITEKITPTKISNAQIVGNINTINKIIKSLNLKGYAIFLPKTKILLEERIFIPMDNKNIKLPVIHADFVFSTGSDGNSLGLALPPSGLKLLQEAEKENVFENINMENLENHLQTFIGLDIFNSVSLKGSDNNWKLMVEKPVYCNKNKFCKQFPCPACSAVLIAITRSIKKRVFIKDVTDNDKKIIFDLKIGD